MEGIKNSMQPHSGENIYTLLTHVRLLVEIRGRFAMSIRLTT